MSKTAKSVNFARPPVVETVLSVQFEKLPAMRSVHFGLFWNEIRNRFSKVEDRPALPVTFEQKDQPLSNKVHLQFESVESLGVQRIWLLDKTGTEMVQIQNDRFVKNWRKQTTAPYPRYEKVVKPSFEKDLRLFQRFLKKENLGLLKINQCEITYVNHIISGEGWDSWGDIAKVFSFYSPVKGSPPGAANDFSIKLRFPITGSKKEWIGWLYVDVQPALNAADKKPMYAMTLTARGMCGKGYEFFDIGRECINRSFVELTTKHMHKIWGIK